MADSNTLVRLEDGSVVNEETGEIIEAGTTDDPIARYTELAIDADVQRKQWDATAKLYKLILNQLGANDETTRAGRVVRRGGHFRASAPRALFDGSFLVQDLPYDKQAEFVRECFSALDPKRVDAMFEAGRISAAVADAIVELKRVAEWMETKALKKQAPEREVVL